jgi:hypothetical protein
MNKTLRDLRYQNSAISPDKMLQNLNKDLDINVSVGICISHQEEAGFTNGSLKTPQYPSGSKWLLTWPGWE